jgi:hypothetical protein
MALIGDYSGPSPVFVYGSRHLLWTTLRILLSSIGIGEKHSSTYNIPYEKNFQEVTAEFIRGYCVDFIPIPERLMDIT